MLVFWVGVRWRVERVGGEVEGRLLGALRWDWWWWYVLVHRGSGQCGVVVLVVLVRAGPLL